MFYFVQTPQWLKKVYNKYTWDFFGAKKAIYLTFDDGPHPTATPFVLNELDKYNAKATFFCIGKNVIEQPDIYNKIISAGHAVGNHTFNHLNGWKTGNSEYVENILEAETCITSDLFRPPYGKVKKAQVKLLHASNPNFRVIMWSVLSGDFDKNKTPEQCLKNVIKNTKSGSIIVFHDSDKAFKNLEYSLPLVLEYFSEKGYRFEKII
jgi:peptidoglycan/xylan/chitin deacetylase (PgdA/CDA1 family)